MRGWDPDRWLDVVCVERGYLFGFNEDHEPCIWAAAHAWVEVAPPPTYPERWITVNTAFGDRIALIHLATDGTLTLHPRERES